MRAAHLCVLAAVVAAVVASGCGSDPATLTHAQFVARANGSCRHAANALAHVRRPKTRAQFNRAVNRSGYIVQRLYDTLEGLDPPAADAQRYEEFLKIFKGDIRA